MKQIYLLFLIFIISALGCTAAVEEQVEAANCCVPFCRGVENQEACEIIGGSFSAASCSQVDECKVGCCTPYCADLTKALCSKEYGYGGVWHAESCSQLDECEKGCCTPFCTELTQAECGSEIGYGGTWHKGSCDSVEECGNICCGPSNTLMTRTACEQSGGSVVDDSLCPSSGKITVQVAHRVSCDCSDDEDETCTESLNLLQSVTLNLIPDPSASDSLFGSIFGGAKKYYYKGTGVSTIEGEETEIRSSQNMVECTNSQAPKGSLGVISMDSTDTRIFTGSNSEEMTVTLTVNKYGNYDISWNYPQLLGMMKDTFTRTTESSCPGSSPYNENDYWETDVEGIIVTEDALINVSLKGSRSFSQRPPEAMYACGDFDNSGMGTITWEFSLPK